MAVEEVQQRVVGFACPLAFPLAGNITRCAEEPAPVSPLAALLQQQSQAFRRPLFVRTSRYRDAEAEPVRSRSLQIGQTRTPVNTARESSSDSAPSSVSTPAICIPDSAR